METNSNFQSQTQTWRLRILWRCSLCTCPWSRFTALKRGVTPRLLLWSTAAPSSSKRLQTVSFPLPAAAVKAATDRNIKEHDDRRYFSTLQPNEISPLKLYMSMYIWHYMTHERALRLIYVVRVTWHITGWCYTFPQYLFHPTDCLVCWSQLSPHLPHLFLEDPGGMKPSICKKKSELFLTSRIIINKWVCHVC